MIDSGALIIFVGYAAALAYLPLQAYAVIKWRGPSRIAALLFIFRRRVFVAIIFTPGSIALGALTPDRPIDAGPQHSGILHPHRKANRARKAANRIRHRTKI